MRSDEGLVIRNMMGGAEDALTSLTHEPLYMLGDELTPEELREALGM